MAYLVKSADILIGCEIVTDTDPIEFHGGRSIGPISTLYDNTGAYVEPVNQWFIHLITSKRLEDLNSYTRALKRYWDFLDREGLDWDKFPPLRRLKPTYLFRNDLLASVNSGGLAHSTANTYINHLVQFYLWAAYERYYQITEEHKPFEIEFVQVKNKNMLTHMMPKFTVQTSDLRIRVPKDSTSKTVRRLNPLPHSALHILSKQLKRTSPEVRLICLLAVQSGLRIKEATGLTLDALNQARQRADSRTHYEITIGPRNGVPTKYKKTRTIEITGQLLQELRHYAIDERRLQRLNKLQDRLDKHRHLFSNPDKADLKPLRLNQKKLKALISANTFEPMFISQQGNPYQPNTIGARFGEIRRLIKNSGHTFNHRFHDLRSSYATYRLQSLIDGGLEASDTLDLLMQWMGHKDESTIWNYIRYLKRKEVLVEKISMLDNIMHQALLESDNE
ncbi:site-specific integrase [Vibrio parahaemolyticus]|nr:site-specific integrase [Vibrio parahaemolyticus]